MTRSCLVFDTTCLSYFARADRLDVLGDLLVGSETVVPHVVREEIRAGIDDHPSLAQILEVEWLHVVPLDTLDRIRRFALWTGRVGAGNRNLGEASVLAIAQELDGIAVIDELTEFGAGNIIDSLAAEGMRLPCAGAGFSRFAKVHGLL